MTTVPKLNYANLRGKSKSKDNDNQPKLQNSSNELFQHMNQQNIKYIHSQIKQKQRKNNQIKLKRKSEEDVDIGQHGKYPEEISEKESRFQETQRGTTKLEVPDLSIKVMKTDGESVRSMSVHERQIGPSKKVSEQAQTHKLSYYDLVSQAKSKRVPSIEAAYQQEQLNLNKQTGQFLNFLTGYIDDLSSVKDQRKRFSKIKNKSQMDKTRNKDQQRQRQRQRQRQKINSITISSASQREILKNNLAEQKIHNMYLAKQIEQQRQQKKIYQKRINRLQQIVTQLAQQFRALQLQQKKPALQKSQIQNMNIYDHRPENNHLSHRKNHTSFSMFTNDNKQPQKSRKIYNEEIIQLQQELYQFNSKGVCQLRGSRRDSYID